MRVNFLIKVKKGPIFMNYINLNEIYKSVVILMYLILLYVLISIFQFDPQIQRYYSMHMTMTERFVPTFKNWCLYMITMVIPIIVVAKILIYKRVGKILCKIVF